MDWEGAGGGAGMSRGHSPFPTLTGSVGVAWGSLPSVERAFPGRAAGKGPRARALCLQLSCADHTHGAALGLLGFRLCPWSQAVMLEIAGLSPVLQMRREAQRDWLASLRPRLEAGVDGGPGLLSGTASHRQEQRRWGGGLRGCHAALCASWHLSASLLLVRGASCSHVGQAPRPAPADVRPEHCIPRAAGPLLDTVLLPWLLGLLLYVPSVALLPRVLPGPSWWGPAGSGQWGALAASRGGPASLPAVPSSAGLPSVGHGFRVIHLLVLPRKAQDLASWVSRSGVPGCSGVCVCVGGVPVSGSRAGVREWGL